MTFFATLIVSYFPSIFSVFFVEFLRFFRLPDWTLADGPYLSRWHLLVDPSVYKHVYMYKYMHDTHTYILHTFIHTHIKYIKTLFFAGEDSLQTDRLVGQLRWGPPPSHGNALHPVVGDTWRITPLGKWLVKGFTSHLELDKSYYLGDLLIMGMDHLLNGMILQVLVSSSLRLLFGFGEEKEGAAERQVPHAKMVGVLDDDNCGSPQQKRCICWFFPFNTQQIKTPFFQVSCHDHLLTSYLPP